MTATISVVINTLNEEKNLPYALRSVRSWVDEIVVVDMHSEDRTCAIAEEYGARVFLHDRLGYADPAREFALAQATGDWLLILDADELVPARLARRLREIMAADDVDIVSIPRLNYLLGAPVNGMGWGLAQDHHDRFFRKGSIKASRHIHAYLERTDGTRVLSLPPDPSLALVHFNYVDAAQFLEKMNRYTSVEAGDAHSRAERPTIRRTLYRGIREWWRRYFKSRGYRDGWRGFYLSFLMVAYRVAVELKLKELQSLGGHDAIEASYHREAERYLADYGEPGRPKGDSDPNPDRPGEPPAD
jgi:glycosyltransferase involved in cell wall biosynthesis